MSEMCTLPVSCDPFNSTGSTDHFLPPWYLRNPHVQTLTGTYIFGRLPTPALQGVTSQKGEVAVGDGDRLVFHDDCPADWQDGHRVVVLLHGLAGSHASPYMVRIAAKLNGLNVRTFRLDWRGSGAGMSLARYPYHSGRSDDLRAAVVAIQDRCQNSPISVAGFSMGGNVALKTLGEVGSVGNGTAGIARAVAVCPPIDLSRTLEFIQTGFARRYNNYFAKICIRDVLKRKQLRPDAVVPDGWFERPPREMREFDESFTAPVCGFASAEAYYAESSANQYLPTITVPTLIIAAQDDPLIPFEPFEIAKLSPSTQLRAPKYGGHLGFVMMSGPGWMDRQVIQWVLGGH